MSFFTGDVTIRICSSRPEAVINKLRYDIPVRKIKKTDGKTAEFTVNSKDKRYAAETSRAYGADFCVVSERGFPLLVSKYKKRTGMFIGLAAAMFLIFYSSGLILEISVEGNTYVSSSDIRKTLSSLGITEGSRKNNEILEHLYNSFLLAEDRISWISINYDGTVAHVEVKEVQQVPKMLDRDKNINIIAKCDGIVRRVDALDGGKEVAPGETVTKGQLLISSFLETRRTGTIMKAARGSVWASTVHNFEVTVPKIETVKSYTGDVHTAKYLKVLGVKIPLSFASPLHYSYFDKSFEESPCFLFGRFKMPFSVIKETDIEYKKAQENIDADRAAKIAAAEIAGRIESELSAAEIIEREERMEETEEAYVFTYELTCLENIGEEVEFVFDGEGLT